MNDLKLIEPFFGEIFRQLVEIPQFQNYLDLHYDVAVGINDDDQTISVNVSPVSFEETAARTKALMIERDKAAPKVTLASEQEVKLLRNKK
jgi:hypothetical protein